MAIDSLPARLAQASPARVDGTWQRHVAARFADTALVGRSANGRWGTEGGFPVLYLGRPTESVTVEAYRHLIDPLVTDAGVSLPAIRPRVLVTCEVSVTELLDLRTPTNRTLAGITLDQLESQTSDRASYAVCQNVSAAAHQLGFHGLVAPAATKLGQTLVLFSDLLTTEEQPVRTATEMWVQLPPDPRNPLQGSSLRVVK